MTTGPLLTTAQIVSALAYTGFRIPTGYFTYSIPTTSSTWPGYAANKEPTAPNQWWPLSSAQAVNFPSAIAAWDALIAPNFVQTNDATSPGAIRIAFSNIATLDVNSLLEGGVANAYVYVYSTPVTESTFADQASTLDIWFNDDSRTESFSTGTYNYKSLVHEMGHALGLSHPFGGINGGPDPLPTQYDSHRYTVMSYTNVGYVTTWASQADGKLYSANNYPYPITPMLLDVIALQQVYGADTNTATGNNRYTFDPAALTLQTIYDAGGADSFDLSTHTRASDIDLTPGSYSSIAIYTIADQIADTAARFPGYVWSAAQFTGSFTWTDNVAIAPNTIIETVLAGSGNDSILGNAAPNWLNGGAGNDYIRGMDGNDFIDGGTGDDDVNGNQGSDQVYGGAGADYVRGGQGHDSVYGGDGNDIHVNGNIGDDSVSGGAGNDTVFGGQNNDTVSGDDGRDSISGDLGNDVLICGPGVDFLMGGTGADLFIFRSGDGIDGIGDFNSVLGDRIGFVSGTSFTITTLMAFNSGLGMSAPPVSYEGFAVIDIAGAGDAIILYGVTVAQLGDWLVYV